MKKAVVLHTHIPGLGVIRALGGKGVPVVALHYENREMGHVSKYVSESIHVPHPEENEKAFIRFLLDYGRRQPGHILIPTNDSTVCIISRHKSSLESCFIVAVPPWEITKKVLIKNYTYRIAESVGVPCPRTVYPGTVEDLRMAFESIMFPCIIKPAEGHKFFEIFKAKMFEAKDQEACLSGFIKARQKGLDVMVQELIPGDDTEGINYNAYFIDGKPVAEFTARKVRLDPPRFGSPRVLVSEKIPEIIETGRALIRTIGFNGFTCTEFKRDSRNGIYKLMEVNGRHNLTGSLAVKCGINFPWIMYCHLSGYPVPLYKDYKSGIYWIDLCKDVQHTLYSRDMENFSLLDYMRPYFKKKVFGVLDSKDPQPIIHRVRTNIRRFPKCLAKRTMRKVFFSARKVRMDVRQVQG